MKYFIDRNNDEVFAFESDGSQDDFIRADLEPLSDEELGEIRAAQEAANAPTPEQVLKSANEKRDELLAKAALRVAPLQDAVDLGDASADDEALLIKWKQYRVDVNRISRQPGFPSTITWPIEPSQA